MGAAGVLLRRVGRPLGNSDWLGRRLGLARASPTTVRRMEFETITYDVRDRIGRLHLNRPEGANAVNPTFARELRAAMLEIAYDDEVKAVAVTAEGRSSARAAT